MKNVTDGKVENVTVCYTDKITLAHVAQTLAEKYDVQIYRDDKADSILVVSAK